VVWLWEACLWYFEQRPIIIWGGVYVRTYRLGRILLQLVVRQLRRALGFWIGSPLFMVQHISTKSFS